MKKLGYQAINLRFIEVLTVITEIEKEEILYIKQRSDQKIIAFKITYDDKIYNLNIFENDKNIVSISEKDNHSFFYVSDILEEEIESFTESIKKKIKKKENKYEVDENFKNEILQIINNKNIITNLKEKYDDVEQLIYVLKNQVNFMTFLYLIEREENISYNNYIKIYDWYFNLSQEYVQTKKYSYLCEDTSRIYFEKQLENITETYNLLYKIWKSMRVDKKFSKNFFDKNKRKISEDFYKKIISKKIFVFLKEQGSD